MTYDIVLTNSKSSIGFQKIRGLGPHLLAAEARRFGFSVAVIDFIEQWSQEDFSRAVQKLVGANTRFFGFSTTWSLDYNSVDPDFSSDDYMGNWMLNGNLEFMIAKVREANPDVTIIAGGKKTRVLKTHLLEKGVDYLFDGYAETDFLEFILDKKIFNRYTTYDNKLEYQRALTSDEFDFTESAATFTEDTFITDREIIPMELTRGCRFKCKFCSFAMIGQKKTQEYMKSKECVRNEMIRNYEMFGTTKYSIQDDTFNDSLEKVEFYADVFASLPFKISFWCYLRAEIVVNYPEMIPLLKDMGLAHTWFGIETFNQQAGKCIGKGMDPERIKDMLYQCKSVWKDDVHIDQGYIVGLPYETLEDLERSKEWFMRDDCPVDSPLFTPLFLRSKRLIEVLDPPDLSEFDLEYEQFGYSFPHENQMITVENARPGLFWEKNDNTDITSFVQAAQIANDLNNSLRDIFYNGDRTRYHMNAASLSKFMSNAHDVMCDDDDAFKAAIKKFYIEPFLFYK